MQSIAPSPEQLLVLRSHRSPALAKAAGVDRRTAERALAGEPLRGPFLRVLLEAAQRIASQPAAPVHQEAAV